MPQITEQELRRQITAGELGTLYLLSGEEKLILKRAAKRLISRAGGDVLPEFNIQEFPGDADIERVADAAAALPMMAERKCVALCDWDPESQPQAQLDKLLELMEDLPETTTLVLYYPTVEGKRSSKWKKLSDKAGKLGYTLSFGRREPPELRKTIISAAQRQGCEMSREAAERLLEYAGTDLNLLMGETDKLCAYALAAEGGRVTPALVESMTPKSTETTVFLMINALLAEEYERAYGMLDALFYQNEDPIMVLGAMSSSYVDIYRVRAALESGLTNEAPMEYCPDYKGKAFRLRNAAKNGRRLSDKALEESLGLLLEADMQLKGSKMEPRLVLEGLIGKLLLAAQDRSGQNPRGGRR